jgi:hypothetical protein
MRCLFHRFGFPLIALAVLLSASCESRSVRLPESGATLEGTVTYGGEPIEFAMVLVQSDTASAQGKIFEDKHYRVENVPLGEVRIGVNTSAARGDYQSKMMASQGKGGGKFIDVPAKYFDPATSEIKTTIDKGSNTYNIVIPR